MQHSPRRPSSPSCSTSLPDLPPTGAIHGPMQTLQHNHLMRDLGDSAADSRRGRPVSLAAAARPADCGASAPWLSCGRGRRRYDPLCGGLAARVSAGRESALRRLLVCPAQDVGECHRVLRSRTLGGVVEHAPRPAIVAGQPPRERVKGLGRIGRVVHAGRAVQAVVA